MRHLRAIYFFSFMLSLSFTINSFALATGLELVGKLNFGNHWGETANPFAAPFNPLWGGQVGVEYAFFKHFSVEGGVRVETFMFKWHRKDEDFHARAVSFGPYVAPKFIWPLEFAAQKLVPFLALTLQLPALSIVAHSIGIGVAGDLVVGTKYIFTHHLGLTFEIGAQIFSRKTNPSGWFMNNKLALGVIIPF